MNLQEMTQAMGGAQTPKQPAQFTPQSMQAAMGGYTPDQHANAFGSSNNMLIQGIGAGWGLVSDLAHGAVKGAESTEAGIGQLGAKMFGNQGLADTLGQVKQQDTQPTNLAEGVGKAGEQVAEFFIPGAGAEAAGLKSLSLADRVSQAGSLVNKGLKVGGAALKGALSFGGITAAQTGDLQKGAEAAPLGGFAGAASGALDVFGKGLGEAMQKADFKLSPAQEAKASGKVDSAAKFMTEHQILGSDQAKYSKLTLLNNSLEDALQKSLPPQMGFSKSEIISNINQSIEKLKEEDPAIYNSAKHDADKAIELLQSKGGGDTIDAKSVLNAKRSYGKAAFKQSRFAVKDPNVVSEGSFAVEQGFQKTLEDTLAKNNALIQVPENLSKYFGGASQVPLQDFNKVYSNAISSKQLTNLARFKNDSGLLGRFFGLWVGESLGQAVSPGLGGKFVGATLGEMASQKAPGFIRGAIERGATAPGLPMGAAQVGQGISDSAGQSTQ